MRLLIAAALAVSVGVPAWANPMCAPVRIVVNELSTKYGETIIEEIKRPTPDGSAILIFHLWENSETGTWTGTVTGPNGLMCIGLSGRDLAGKTLADLLTPINA